MNQSYSCTSECKAFDAAQTKEPCKLLYFLERLTRTGRSAPPPPTVRP